jgi:hypothetical protein
MYLPLDTDAMPPLGQCAQCHGLATDAPLTKGRLSFRRGSPAPGMPQVLAPVIGPQPAELIPQHSHPQVSHDPKRQHTKENYQFNYKS